MLMVVSASNGKPRFLYVMRAGPQLSKIGWSFDPLKRAASAHWVRGDDGRLVAMDVPERPVVVWRKRYSNHMAANAVELCTKYLLQNFRQRGEWYSLAPARVIEAAEYVGKVLKPKNLSGGFSFISAHEPWPATDEANTLGA